MKHKCFDLENNEKSVLIKENNDKFVFWLMKNENMCFDCGKTMTNTCFDFGNAMKNPCFD